MLYVNKNLHVYTHTHYLHKAFSKNKCQVSNFFTKNLTLELKLNGLVFLG